MEGLSVQSENYNLYLSYKCNHGLARHEKISGEKIVVVTMFGTDIVETKWINLSPRMKKIYIDEVKRNRRKIIKKEDEFLLSA